MLNPLLAATGWKPRFPAEGLYNRVAKPGAGAGAGTSDGENTVKVVRS